MTRNSDDMSSGTKVCALSVHLNFSNKSAPRRCELSFSTRAVGRDPREICSPLAPTRKKEGCERHLVDHGSGEDLGQPGMQSCRGDLVSRRAQK